MQVAEAYRLGPGLTGALERSPNFVIQVHSSHCPHCPAQRAFLQRDVDRIREQRGVACEGESTSNNDADWADRSATDIARWRTSAEEGVGSRICAEAGYIEVERAAGRRCEV